MKASEGENLRIRARNERYRTGKDQADASKLVATNGLRFAVQGTRGRWSKHGIDPQEAATVAGAVPVGGAWGFEAADGVLTRGDGSITPVINERGDYRLFWTALAVAILGEGPNPVPAREALAVMEVLDAGLRSSADGQTVML